MKSIEPHQASILEIIDPCIDPNGITASNQPLSPFLPYIYDLEPFVYEVSRFESIPPGCDITYTCMQVTGPGLESFSCDIPDVSTFDD